jgi:type II secretory pathway component PulF
MARFHYIASNMEGKVIEGDISADSSAAVLGWMSDQGLKPVAIKEVKERSWMKKSFGESISIEDKVFLTKYLALMLRVGTDLFKAIDILVSDFDKPAVKSLLLEVKDILSKGQPLYTAFARRPNDFSPVFVSLIRAGEESGNLETVFNRLSKDTEKEKELRSKIKAALIYPIILVGLSLTILFLMVTFALPKIAETFLTGNVQPPLFSRIVFGAGLFLRNNLIIILPALAILVFALLFFFTKTKGGKIARTRIISSTPVVKGVVKKMAIQRFAGTLSSLMRSGMPILDALETSANAVGSDELSSILRRIARDGIAKGLTVGEAFRREPYFPKVVSNLISVSEQAGHMEEVLETLAEFYEGEIDSSVKTLVAFLEPVLLLSIGIVIAIIALAVIVPVYQLVGQV